MSRQSVPMRLTAGEAAGDDRVGKLERINVASGVSEFSPPARRIAKVVGEGELARLDELERRPRGGRKFFERGRRDAIVGIVKQRRGVVEVARQIAR